MSNDPSKYHRKMPPSNRERIAAAPRGQSISSEMAGQALTRPSEPPVH